MGMRIFGDRDGKPLQDIQLLFKDFKPKEAGSMEGLSLGAVDKAILNKDGCDICFHWKDGFGNCKCSELKVHRRYEDIEKWENRRKNYENKDKVLKKLV